MNALAPLVGLTLLLAGCAGSKGGTSPAQGTLASAVAVEPNISPSVQGEMVTFTAFVTGSASPSFIGGTVTFYAVGPYGGNPVQLGIVTLSHGPYDSASTGEATLSTAGLAQGPNVITAAFSGDASYQGSTSAPWTQNVNPGAGAAEPTKPAVKALR